MRKPSKKTLTIKLDNAWSKAVRLKAKNKCEVCGKTESLNSHHIEGRRNYALRWDIQNGVCLCSGCHVFKKESAHQSPEWFHFWLEDNKWQDLQYVMNNRNDIKKWTIEDMQDKLTELNDIIKKWE